VSGVQSFRGFRDVNLCQYEYNDVFAGRNWNNGETVGKRVASLENVSG
jgi:hypothetical protein